ncbi:uncharacterized protein JCM15063_000297 [Sporobolomyces koalae]|uniref:uncharacterized protein n=1 Tax=Sporobolomyces koalae TaxID=500713 RepID=UPI00317AD80C
MPSSKAAGKQRQEEPVPEIEVPVAPEPSLAVTQPHVAPEQATKAKTKRTKSSSSNKRKAEQKLAAMERAQKLEKRKVEMGSKKDQRKKAKQMWQ